MVVGNDADAYLKQMWKICKQNLLKILIKTKLINKNNLGTRIEYTYCSYQMEYKKKKKIYFLIDYKRLKLMTAYM